MSPLGLCVREAGDANADNTNTGMSPVVYSAQNSFPSTISFDAQGCARERGRIGALISIF